MNGFDDFDTQVQSDEPTNYDDDTVIVAWSDGSEPYECHYEDYEPSPYDGTYSEE